MPVIIKVGSDEIEKQVIPCGVSQAVPLFPPANGSLIMPIQVDANGSQFVRPSGGQIPADGLPAPVTNGDVTSYTMVWNGVTWDRAASLSSNADGLAANQIGLIGSITRNTVFNGGTWDRQRIGQDADGQAASNLGQIATISKLLIWGGAFWSRPLAGTLTSGAGFDNFFSASANILRTLSAETVYNGTGWDRKRTPNVFKTAVVTAAGSTAVWTPAAGKKFRLMGYSIEITGNAIQAAAGNFEITLLDAAAAIGIGSSLYVPAVALNVFGSNALNPINIGNGYLSALANNVLNVNLSNALTAGEIRVNVWGTEE